MLRSWAGLFWSWRSKSNKLIVIILQLSSSPNYNTIMSDESGVNFPDSSLIIHHFGDLMDLRDEANEPIAILVPSVKTAKRSK